MAKVCKNSQELYNELMKMINESLKDDVAPIVKKVMLDRINEEVYKKYEPSYYMRRGEDGGLADPDNIVSEIVYDGCLSVTNETLGREFYFYEGEPVRSDNADKPIAEIIETGEGYDYWDNAFPRPFMQSTVDKLKETDLVEIVLKKSLKMKGLEVK